MDTRADRVPDEPGHPAATGPDAEGGPPPPHPTAAQQESYTVGSLWAEAGITPGRRAVKWWHYGAGPLAAGAAVLVVDQVCKAWVLTSLGDEEQGASWLNGTFSIIRVDNNGAAFGLLAGQMVLFVLIAVVVAAVLVAYYRLLPRERLWLRISLGLQLGGALGNLLDRLRHGYVVDFMEVRDFPVFNVADAAIVCGVLILAYYLVVRMERPAQPNAAGRAATGGHDDGGARGLPPAAP